MVKLGMAPMDAIQSATSRAAEMLEMKGEIGVVAPGAYAEVIAVAGDPLKDVGELEQVRFVMHNGAVFKNEMAKGREFGVDIRSKPASRAMPPARRPPGARRGARRRR